MYFIDTETCGLHGIIVLIQYAKDDSETQLYCPWTEEIGDTLILIEQFCEEGVVGFNLVFDWFHLVKLYNTLLKLADKEGLSAYPINHIEKMEECEYEARDGLCLKPKHIFDLFMHARKGPYQTTMERSDIRIKKVPLPLAKPLCKVLNERVKLNKIYFARRKDQTRETWAVYPNEEDKNFRDICLKFAPSSALKALGQDALDVKDDVMLLFADVEVAHNLRPKELGYAPYAKAVGEDGWTDVIRYHISHWQYNELARKYAKDDVEKYTRPLYHYFNALEHGYNNENARKYATSNKWDLEIKLSIDDTDSVLTAAVANCRWKGFKIDVEAIKKQREQYVATSISAPKDPGSAKRWLYEVMESAEKMILTTTKKTMLEEVAKWGNEAAKRAQMILDARKATKKIELFDKLIHAGRFHASFKVIGALSGRMSGADGLNPQGIDHTEEVRACFTLAHDGQEMSGGDFESFEVVLADADYDDPDLHADLLQGKKIHALFGENLFPEENYDSILASKGTEDDKYSRSKQGVFALIYGGNENTLVDRVGIDLEAATEGSKKFMDKYKGVGRARKKIFDSFCSMRQPGGIGTAVEWHQPADYLESMLGFRRYFTLENKICKTLFNLAQNPPAEWKKLKIKVQRRDRLQTAAGATMSALYAAAFAIQAANMRAAANHRIQSTGAQITKEIQRTIWDFQPVGATDFHVMVLNIHDEIISPHKKGMAKDIEDAVMDRVEDFREQVPLISMDWSSNLTNWSQK